MRKLTVALLFVIAILLAGRFWQELNSIANAGGDDPISTLLNGDVNGDQILDMSDAVYLLIHLFNGGAEPVALADSPEVLERLEALEARGLSDEQYEILGHMSIQQLPVNDDGNTAKAIRFSGVNVQVVNGMGSTREVNGLGNLIVGYQEIRNPPEGDFADETVRGGSHNLVVGYGNNYSFYASQVVGANNTISGPFSTVSGGENNLADGYHATVAGGLNNIASGDWSTVSGGEENRVDGQGATVSGGRNATVSGNYSTVSGGWDNTISADWATVSGGSGNTASGELSTVSGGQRNRAEGHGSTVSSGENNTASGWMSTVSGGLNNIANGRLSTISGGERNSSPGDWSMVSGGDNNHARSREIHRP